MRVYKQIRFEERVKIAEMKGAGQSVGSIAKSLRRSRSTIYRELKRNEAPPGAYWPDTAEHKAKHRRQRACRLDKDACLQNFVRTKLCYHYWTPEQIAGWLKHRQKRLKGISHETIYAWLYRAPQKREKLWKFLPRHKAKRGLRKTRNGGQGRIPHRVSIHSRPLKVDGGKEFGHWEGDLMSFRKNAEHMLVLRERATMLTLSTPLPSKKSLDTARAIMRLMGKVPQRARKTLTLDNGGEFARHKDVADALTLATYFCDPYASWQKGGIENTNGRLRRDLPRSTRIKTMQKDNFDETIDNYNTTPRKALKWLTPLEAFHKNLNRVALQT